MRWLSSAAAALSCLAVASTAHATLPQEGEPLRSNDYSIDLYQGPVLSAIRVIALGGAFVAIADGVEGSAMNPAAAAVRFPFSYQHFDYDVGAGITFPSAINNTDFWNSGRPTRLPKSKSLNFVFLNVALDLQVGAWGFGLASDFQRYSLLRAEDPTLERQRDRLEAQIAIGHLHLAHAFADGQLLIGVGSRTSGLSISNENDPTLADRELFSTAGAGLEAGFIWKPTDWQIRIGGAYHAGFTTEASPESEVFVIYEDDPVNRLYLPERVALPWDVMIGFAAQLGPRPLNPRWINPDEVLESTRRYLDFRQRERERLLRRAEVTPQGPFETWVEREKRVRDLRRELARQREQDLQELAQLESDLVRRLRARYRAMPRFRVLVTTQLVLTGPTKNAVGIESMLNRTVQRAGETLTASPHLGLETEAIPHWLKLRAGTYLEPTRFRSNNKGARLHATFGFEQKLFPWTVFGLLAEGTEWRVSASVDASRNYLGWGTGLGLWR